jgi:hypothetical protein
MNSIFGKTEKHLQRFCNGAIVAIAQGVIHKFGSIAIINIMDVILNALRGIPRI